MIVDGSYMPWVRPTRRVHLALSVGMTLTGLILALAGVSGGPGQERTAPSIGRTADGVADGPKNTAGTLVPPAPLVYFAPLPLASRFASLPFASPFASLLAPPPLVPSHGLPHPTPPHPGAAKSTDAKPHAKPKPHPRHTPHSSDLLRPGSHPEPHPAPRPKAPTPPLSRPPLPPPPLKR